VVTRLQDIIGSDSWNPLLAAVMARKKEAVRALVQSYPIAEHDVNLFIPAVSREVLRASVHWGEPDVFQWLLLHHQVRVWRS